MFQIPLEVGIRKGSDDGVPIVISAPDSDVSKAYVDVAQKVISRLDELSKEEHSRPEISLWFSQSSRLLLTTEVLVLFSVHWCRIYSKQKNSCQTNYYTVHILLYLIDTHPNLLDLKWWIVLSVHPFPSKSIKGENKGLRKDGIHFGTLTQDKTRHHI